MKKILFATVVAACLFVASVSEASSRRKSGESRCSYSPLQDLIRNARSGKDLEPVLGGRVDLEAPVKCGGTILQLAIRRGNPEVVKLLLESGVSVKDNVSLNDFPIEGAPDKVPLLMFAAYYSPRQDILNLIISAGADMTTTDSNGENLLWYLDKNPVLQNTVIGDNIKNALLFNIQPEAKESKDNIGTSPVQPAAIQNVAPVQGGGQPVVPPAPKMIISQQPDGSIGVPAEAIQGSVNASNSGVPAFKSMGKKPVEIVEPSIMIK